MKSKHRATRRTALILLLCLFPLTSAAILLAIRIFKQMKPTPAAA